jgi:hypothetical protein
VDGDLLSYRGDSPLKVRRRPGLLPHDRDRKDDVGLLARCGQMPIEGHDPADTGERCTSQSRVGEVGERVSAEKNQQLDTTLSRIAEDLGGSGRTPQAGGESASGVASAHDREHSSIRDGPEHRADSSRHGG